MDDQTHVHARLDWLHPIDNERKWALHDPVYAAEQ